MKLERFIAKRYFISKHKLNFITIISIISTLGITIGVASLIVVLSVFNGFGNLVEELLTSLDPDMRVEIINDDKINLSTFEEYVRNNYKIKSFSPYLISRSLFESKYSQIVAEVKGINLNKIFSIYDSNKVNFNLNEYDKSTLPKIYIGLILANELQVDLNDTITIYAPTSLNSFLSGFSPIKKGIFIVKGIFYSQNNQYDRSLALIDIRDSFSLFGSGKKIKGYEISLKNQEDFNDVKYFFDEKFSDNIEILSKYEIHKELFSVMKIERWVAYLLLSLIIAVASFNILSSLSMTVLEKKRDISIMKAFGIPERSLLKIFLNEGAIIGIIGTIIGTFLGLFICWLQLEFKVYPLDPTQYKIDSLPLKIQISDFFIVAFASMSLSILAASFPAMRAAKTNLIEGIKWE